MHFFAKAPISIKTQYQEDKSFFHSSIFDQELLKYLSAFQMKAKCTLRFIGDGVLYFFPSLLWFAHFTRNGDADNTGATGTFMFWELKVFLAPV